MVYVRFKESTSLLTMVIIPNNLTTSVWPRVQAIGNMATGAGRSICCAAC